MDTQEIGQLPRIRAEAREIQYAARAIKRYVERALRRANPKDATAASGLDLS
jgi:hypothetical protein